MKVHVSDLQIGDTLKENVFNRYGLHVISSDSVLSANDIAMLFRHGIEYVDIAPRFVNIQEKLAEFQMQAQNKAKLIPLYEDAIAGVKELFEQAGLNGAVDPAIVNQTYDPLVEHFRRETDVVSLLLTLNSQDEYTYQHCVQVGMISYFLAKWLGRSEQEAQRIGKAGYLHDIGKGMIPNSILQKPGRLTHQEFEEVKKHTTYGHDIIVHSLEDAPTALVALQHHERMNGRGYPNGDSDEQIHPYAKIVAVADVYSAMISSRVYQERKDLLFVLQEMFNLSFSELDPTATHTFIRNMIPNFIGKKIYLANGEIGDIVMTNPNDFFRPLIRVDQKFIDLSKNKHLEIKDIQM